MVYAPRNSAPRCHQLERLLCLPFRLPFNPFFLQETGTRGLRTIFCCFTTTEKFHPGNNDRGIFCDRPLHLETRGESLSHPEHNLPIWLLHLTHALLLTLPDTRRNATNYYSLQLHTLIINRHCQLLRFKALGVA
jgi:hypothetical protein